MTTIINIATNNAIAQERYWSFHRPVIELSGHMNFTSPFESSDSCNTCNGARCDYCEKVVTAGHFEFSVNSNELFQWMLEANVPENVATEIVFGERGHSYGGYHLEWPTEETLAEEFPEFYNTLTSPDGEVMDVIESFRGQFDTFHALREAVFAHFDLGKYCLSGHVYNQLEMYWYSCDYDHKKACAFSDDHNVDAELTADAELTVYKEEEKTMKNTINAINEIRRTLSPKGYNHACEDFAVFTYAPGDVFAICVEARTCTSCWQVGHDEEHVYAEVGERIKVSSLLSDPDLDPLYSEEDVEYFLSIDPNWDESLPVPTVATAVAELTVPEEVNEMNNHKYPTIGRLERDLAVESMLMEANKYPAIGQPEQERVINSAKYGLDFDTNNTTVHEEEADYMCTLKYDHGIEIFMSHNPNAGCDSGEYHTLYINGVVLDACRCGNGCHHTAAINRLEDEEYVLFLLGEVEFDPREESASLSIHSTEPETKTSLQLQYEAARQRILDSGVKVPEDQFYYEVLTSVHRVDSFTVIVRKFMMPEDFAAEMKLKKLRLVHEGGTLADFKDVDIIDVFSCDKDTLHTVIQWVKRWGCISVEELFQEDTVESSVELKEIDKPQEEEDQTESLQDLKEFRDLIEVLNATSAELMSSEEEAAIMESYREFRKVMNKKRGKR